MARLSISQGRSDVHRIDVNDLHIDAQTHNGRRFQPSAEKVHSLAESIIKVGQIEPIIIRKIADNVYTPVAGFTRCAAIKLINDDSGLRSKAGLSEGEIFPIKAISQDLNETDALLRNIAENLERNSTSPVDDAHMQERLRDRKGWTNVQIAEFYHCTPAQVSALSNLLLLSDSEQLLLHNEIITQRNAIDLARLMPEQRQEVLDKATQPVLTIPEPQDITEITERSEINQESLDVPINQQVDNQQLSKEIAKARGKSAWRSYAEIKRTLKDVADQEGQLDITQTICQSFYEWIAGEKEIDDVLDIIEGINSINVH